MFIFVPWYWSNEYRKETPVGFVLDEEETEYQQAYGLDMEQMAWRRAKIIELKDPMLFMQEYPATAQEAFQMTGHDSYIKAEPVMRARKAKLEGHGALVLGVDPARFGDDRFVIYARQGRRAWKVGSWPKIDVVGGANRVKRLRPLCSAAAMISRNLKLAAASAMVQARPATAVTPTAAVTSPPVVTAFWTVVCSWVIAPTNSSGQSMVIASNGSCSLPSISAHLASSTNDK